MVSAISFVPRNDAVLRDDGYPSLLIPVHRNNGDGSEDLSPREAIEDMIDLAHSAVAADLLARLLKQSPAFLEQLMLRRLVKMGYGGLQTPTEHLGAPATRALTASSGWIPLASTLFMSSPDQALYRTPRHSGLCRGTPRRAGLSVPKPGL